MSQSKTKRAKSEKKGRTAEHIAALSLRLKGYRILKRRFKTRVGEIDLIAKRGNTLVFIEVKARKTAGDAFLAIAYKQRRRIEAAAKAWLQQETQSYRYMRFDVIAVPAYWWPTHMRHAWRLGE